MLYFLYLYFAGPQLRWKPWIYFVAIPPLVQIYCYVKYFLKDDVWHNALVQEAYAGLHSVYYVDELSRIVHIISRLSLFIGGPWLFTKVFKWNKARGAREKMLKIGLGVVMVWSFSALGLTIEYTYRSFNQIPQSVLNTIFLHGVTFAFFIFWQVWPLYYKAGIVAFEKETFNIDMQNRRHLAGVDLSKVLKDIKRVLETEKAFKEEDISLPELAEELHLTVHQLSEYFNRHLKIKFNEHINKLRVEEAKRLLRDEPECSVIDICYAVGYNSTSAFYRTFKQHVGCTPKDWRARTSKKS
ncbi:MAG: helix-turn-helix domain-containing protein [Leptospirales bacterium]